MISLSEFRKILGSKAEGKTDKEIEVMRDTLDKFADIAFDRWIKKRNNPKNNDCDNSLPVIKY